MENTPGVSFVFGMVYSLAVSNLAIHPDQYRKYVDGNALAEMVSSVRALGIIEPILFTSIEGKLFVVAGQIRFLAAQKLGLDSIQGRYVEGDLDEISLAENVTRADTSVIDLAEGLLMFRERKQHSNAALAVKLGKSAAWMSEILSINRLPLDIRDYCRGRKEFSLRKLVWVAAAGDEGAIRARFEALLTNANARDKKKADPVQKAIDRMVLLDRDFQQLQDASLTDDEFRALIKHMEHLKYSFLAFAFSRTPKPSARRTTILQHENVDSSHAEDRTSSHKTSKG